MYRYKKIVDLELFKGDNNSHLTNLIFLKKYFFVKNVILVIKDPQQEQNI